MLSRSFLYAFTLDFSAFFAPSALNCVFEMERSLKKPRAEDADPRLWQKKEEKKRFFRPSLHLSYAALHGSFLMAPLRLPYGSPTLIDLK
jgi:hypothetical protein